MKSMWAFIDSLDLTLLAAGFALICLAVGVSLVFSPGWGLIVLSGLALIYIVLPDQKGESA